MTYVEVEKVVEKIVEKVVTKIVKEEVIVEVPVPVHVTTGERKRLASYDPSRFSSTQPSGVSSCAHFPRD